MPVVRINDATFANLSTLKTWFGTKSPSDTIDRIAQDAMENLGIERDAEAAAVSANGTLVFGTAPSLPYTKPTKATINGKSLPNPNWASILNMMIAQVKTRGLDGKDLVQALGIPSKATVYEEEGYKYSPELGISVQGQSASDAWKEIDRLAKKWQILVIVEFFWRQHPKAKHPGKSGLLQSGSS